MAEDHRAVVDAAKRPEWIAAAVRTAIEGRDLVPGEAVDPVLLSARIGCPPHDAAEALARLAISGDVVRHAGRWRVSAQPLPPRAILARARPALLAIVRMAATNRSAGHLAILFHERGRMIGHVPDATVRKRADAYRQVIRTLAHATGSRYYVRVVERLLREAGDLIESVFARRQPGDDPRHKGEILRLVEAIDEGDATAAEIAAEDHLIMLGHHLDTVMLTTA